MRTAPSTSAPAEQKKDQGFTLIELLVVVVIIGILAAVAIPVFLSQREKAADAGTKSDLKNAATLMETYYVDNQGYGSATGAKSTSVSTATQLSELQSTDGVTISVVRVRTASGTTPASFCLQGAHTNSDEVFSYDSATGGLQDGNCPAT